MDRCLLKGEQGDRLHAVLCAAGYNFHWLLRMIAKKGVTFLWPLYWCMRDVAGMPQKWGEFLARVTKLVNRPSNLTSLAY
jgi:transposase, IS5 family